jgi:hypothetical protein
VTLAGLASDPELAIQISMGTQHFRDGLVTLTLRGDGHATVVRRLADGEERHESELSAEERQSLADEFDSIDLTGLRATEGERKPGDTPVNVLVVRDGKTVSDQHLWFGDRYTDKGLDRLVRRFDEVVGRLEAAG